MDLEALVEVRFDESVLDDGRVTLTELRGITTKNIENLIHLTAAGTLFSELPLEGNSSLNLAEQDVPWHHLRSHPPRPVFPGSEF